MTPDLTRFSCRLCQAETHFYHQDKRRTYAQCTRCHLVMADPVHWLNAEQEKQEYDLHENRIDDPGYLGFLSRIVEPVIERIGTNKTLLDFGCGPAPALADLFKQRGLEVCLYDVFYFNNPQVLQNTYHAITLTEVIEHLHSPFEVINQLWQCLKPGGVLAIMTQRVISLERFNHWQYKNDPTHVCFFSEASFKWLGHELKAKPITFTDRDIVLLTKAD